MDTIRSTSTAPTEYETRGARPRMLYQRIQEQILEDLRTSGVAAGERYSTEKELAQKLNVCRTTVRKAITALEQKGYLTRRQRVGTIVGDKLSLEGAPNVFSKLTRNVPPITRRRVIVVLPGWNDNVEGFYSGQLLRALSSPTLSPPFAIEVRHCNDPFIPDNMPIFAVVATDPELPIIPILMEMANQGVRVIVLPGERIDGLVNLYLDRYRIVYDAVKRFYQMGHRVVGLTNGCIHHMDFENSYVAYLDAHRDLNIPIHPRAIIQTRRDSKPPIPPDVRNITAWICGALKHMDWIVEECIKAGLKIPDDVSVLSLDDPGDQPLPLIGKRLSVETIDFDATASLIQNLLNDWQDSRRGTLMAIPSKRIDRETIGPPRGGEK